MLVLPKWQTMWLESQFCSKNIINVPSQQSQKVLDDLKTSCCSPNKAVQLEALKCWGIWINNQNLDDWKMNSICFTAVRPLISKKLQPLYKDVDICKKKLSLMWALLVKVQSIMHLEGPQYILEVFLQSCLTWLSSTNADECENEISYLIFQLLLGIISKNESGCDREIFPPLSSDILLSTKVFHHLADKFLNVFIHWRKVRDKNIILKLWKHFLEHCELSCEHIPIPVWHKIFKLADQICSEKNESIKERLSFLHSCATTLKSTLSSSKFIDFGNLLTTPCEALFKKLVELCNVECNDCYDLDMFMYAKEICQVLSDKSVAVGGFDFCIHVLDVLEDFSLRSLFWGVWCGLVHCYKVQLSNIDRSHFTKVQMTFYRKLRGVAVNLELDKNTLHKNCLTEVIKHVKVLNIGCFCAGGSKTDEIEDCEMKTSETLHTETEPLDCPSLSQPPSKEIVPMTPNIRGGFVTVSFYNKSKLPTKTATYTFGLIKNILGEIGANSAQPLFNGLFSFRFFITRTPPPVLALPSSNLPPIWLKTETEKKSSRNLTLPYIALKPLPRLCSPAKKTSVHKKDSKDEVISVPNTRSRRRAEEEEKKKELENQRRKKRKSFEVIVQEIVKKNKERKTEKISKGRRSPILLRGKQSKRKIQKKPEAVIKKSVVKKLVKKENKKALERKLKNSKKEEPKNQKQKEKKFCKTAGKLENYFKVITKKSGSETRKKEEKKPKKDKKTKKNKENSCCKSGKEEKGKKGEIAWRQTSLKAMMNKKSKGEKVKNGSRIRRKGTEPIEEKPSIKVDKKVTGSPLAKLSPFKEVFHDHEYAKIKPQELLSFEKVLLAKKKKNEIEVLHLKKVVEDRVNTSPLRILETESVVKFTPEIKVEKAEIQVEQKETSPLDQILTEKVENVIKRDESSPVANAIDNHVSLEESPEDFVEMVSTPTRKAKKRVKILDNFKPNKRIKFDEEEKLPLEITEKENLEKKQTELKKEKTVMKYDSSPKAVNEMISSRALRMIALVPDSTKSSQLQRESPSRAELLKCKKAPNVDKNSRASKMLALLSETVVELDDVTETETEEINSNKELLRSPTVKTPVSSLKSPNAIKKKKSIRFDEAKNETVLYQTDTPPSQILEEKEKCRRIQSIDSIMNLS